MTFLTHIVVLHYSTKLGNLFNQKAPAKPDRRGGQYMEVNERKRIMTKKQNQRTALTVCLLLVVSILFAGCEKKTLPAEKPAATTTAKPQAKPAAKPKEKPAGTTTEKPQALPAPKAQSKATEVEGTWIGPEAADQQSKWTFKFAGNRLEVTGPTNQEWYKGSILISPEESPKRADFIIQECSDESLVGKISVGIYKLDGKKLTLAASAPGNTTRPTALDSQSDGRLWTLTKQ